MRFEKKMVHESQQIKHQVFKTEIALLNPYAQNPDISGMTAVVQYPV